MVRPETALWRFLLFTSIVLSPVHIVAGNDAVVLYNAALVQFEAGKYDAALPLIQEAVQLSPEDSVYHHLLGKCYGRIAEQATWIKAIKFATKTMVEFQKAVDLDPNNTEALRDLMEYYRQAPKFLGGSTVRAEEIERHLNTLSGEDSPG